MTISGGNRTSRKGSSGGCCAATGLKSSNVRMIGFIWVHPGRVKHGAAVLPAWVSDSETVCREFPEETRWATTMPRVGAGLHPLNGEAGRRASLRGREA